MDGSQLHPLRKEHLEGGFQWALGWPCARLVEEGEQSVPASEQVWQLSSRDLSLQGMNHNKFLRRMNQTGRKTQSCWGKEHISSFFSLLHKKEIEFQGKEELKGRRLPLSLNKIFFFCFTVLYFLSLSPTLFGIIPSFVWACATKLVSTISHFSNLLPYCTPTFYFWATWASTWIVAAHTSWSSFN